MIDSLLGSNPVDPAIEVRRRGAGQADHISVRLRPGDGDAYANVPGRAAYTTPPMPRRRSGHTCVPIRRCRLRSSRSLSVDWPKSAPLRAAWVRWPARWGKGGIDPALRPESGAVLDTLERLRQDLREMVKGNVRTADRADRADGANVEGSLEREEPPVDRYTVNGVHAHVEIRPPGLPPLMLSE
jgi:hypothetical protein